MVQPTDERISKLVTRARTGDARAFASLYQRFFDRVYVYLLTALGNPDDAQDVAQDVFARALAILDRYEPRRGEFRDWLFSIVRSQAIDHRRRGARTTLIDPHRMAIEAASLAQRGGPLAERLDPGQGVRSLTAALPERQRRVLALRFVFELSSVEIADVVGSTPAAVRQAQRRALKTLLREQEDAV